jgi:UDP-N-acetylmuramyl pentapeptide synthase
LVGGDFEHVDHHYRYFPNSGEAAIWLKKQHLEDGLFLIKGSRSMKMELVMTAFEQ